MRIRNLWIPLAVVLAAFTTVPRTAAATAADGCPRGGRLVVNADLSYSNSLDTGDDGHAWALDAARERMQIWEIGKNSYCLKRQDMGTFRTFAGVSPAGSGMVSEGVTGRFHAELAAVIQGTFSPTVATRGYVGAFDRKCDKNGTCLLPPVTPIGLYFSTVDSVELVRGRWIYVGGACGVFRQSLDSSSGDIVC